MSLILKQFLHLQVKDSWDTSKSHFVNVYRILVLIPDSGRVRCSSKKIFCKSPVAKIQSFDVLLKLMFGRGHRQEDNTQLAVLSLTCQSYLCPDTLLLVKQLINVSFTLYGTFSKPTRDSIHNEF